MAIQVDAKGNPIPTPVNCDSVFGLSKATGDNPFSCDEPTSKVDLAQLGFTCYKESASGAFDAITRLTSQGNTVLTRKT